MKPVRLWRHAVCPLALGWACTVGASPSILITNLPNYGSSGNLAGVVLGAEPATTRVAVFIYVPGAGWWSKPTCAQPLTPIQTNGSWTADITTGGTDQLATRAAALLVGTNYDEPCVQGLNFLPTNVFAQALAKTVVSRAAPGVRWVSFSGYDWWVKSSAGTVGPGPNFFSDSTNNVWVDAAGQLHVRITNRSNAWQCAELVSARTFGYGSYRFELNSRADKLDPNVVLGLFTWSDDPVYAYREIDVECARFGNATDPNSAQFVVQPYYLAGHLARYPVSAGFTNSMHWFTWEQDRVSFHALRGGYSPSPPLAAIITNWTYTLTVPQSGDENVRINLWLFNGSPPTDQQEAEIVLKSFEFVPPGTPPAATLTNANALPDGPFHFLIATEPDWRYAVRSSTNLADWQDMATLLATNTVMQYSETGARTRFFRTATLP